jgi:valyl-tRNA synthetase
VFSQLAGIDDGPPALGIADRWIKARLRATIASVHENFAIYRLDLIAQTLYDFAWYELCDWYLELTKAVLTDPHADLALRRGAQHTLVEVLGSLLKLLHPLMPFVTEELWLELAARRNYSSATIMLERFPQPTDFAADATAEDEIGWLKGFVGGIRQIRGEANLPRSATLNVRLADATSPDRERIERHASQLRKLAGIDRIELVPSGETVKGAATALLGAMRILVPLAGLIDVAAERERLGKQLAKTNDDLGKVQRKLENQNFVANAPPDVVAKEHARVAELEQRATQLEQQIARLAELG